MQQLNSFLQHKQTDPSHTMHGTNGIFAYIEKGLIQAMSTDHLPI